MSALAKLADEALWLEIGRVEDVPRRGARRVQTPDGFIAIFRTSDDEVFALADKCPHKGGPLSQGIVHGRAVACPLHNWSIDLESGEAMGADRGKGCAPRVPVRVVEGVISIAPRNAPTP
jgi:nitrite reductase (NADH) small subunit